MLPPPLTTWSSRAKLGLDPIKEQVEQDVWQTSEVQLDVGSDERLILGCGSLCQICTFRDGSQAIENILMPLLAHVTNLAASS